jgi:hypothetical protein
MNIIQIKFSPIDSTRLISCGKENIRFWRISPNAGEYGVRSIRGKAVALGSDLARGSIFTALDFEFPVRQNTLIYGGGGDSAKEFETLKHIYIASKSGDVF